MEKLLLTTGEAAEVLGISQAKVYNLLLRAELESVTIGSCRRIPAEALHNYVARIRAEQKPDVA